MVSLLGIIFATKHWLLRLPQKVDIIDTRHRRFWNNTLSVKRFIPTQILYTSVYPPILNPRVPPAWEKMAEHVTKVINVPQLKLEYENVYRPLLVVKKGQSAGMSYEPGKLTKTGDQRPQAKRSDIIPVARNLQVKVIHCILNNETEAKIQEMVRKECDRVRQGNVPLEEITCSKKLTRELSEYKTKNLPHVVVAQQMISSGVPVHKGDFVKYVIAHGNGPKYKRAVIPTSEVRLDYDGYVKDLVQTVQQIFNVIKKTVEPRKRRRFA